MTTEELMKQIKYYDVLVTGEAELDANKNLVKGADGKVKITWMRNGNPSAEVKSKGLGDGRFLQCEFVEVNTVSNTIPIPEKGIAELGPLTMRGVSRNLFENQQRNPFNAIGTKLIAGEFTIIKEAVGGDKPIRPVAKLNNFAMPGKQLPYTVGFEYYQHQRSSITHNEEKTMGWKYVDGKLVQSPTIRTTAQMFLFGDEIEIADQLVANAIAAHAKFKVPQATGVREAEANIITATKEPASTIIATV